MYRNRLIKKMLTHLALLFSSVFALFPFVWMGLTSFKSKAEVYTSPVTWRPQELSFQSYRKLLELRYDRYFLNSVMVAGFVMLVVIALATLAAYGFSRFRFRGRRVFFSTSLMGQLLPASVMFLPLFKFLGKYFLDSYFSLFIIYTAILLPYSIWALTTYFNSISTALDEAAMIDGCSRMQVLLRVVVPPAMPGIVSIALYAFNVAWQEFLFALLFINSMEKRTLPLALVAFRGQYEIEWGPMMAASLVTTLPVAIFFVIMQRSLVSGLTGGAIKE